MIDQKQWMDYLHLMDSVTKTLEQLVEIEQSKTMAVTRGAVIDVEECMKREQALSLSLRGYDQRRETMLARMGIEGIPLRRLEEFAPEELVMETKQTANALRRQYEAFQSVSRTARNTLESNLRMIEKLQQSAAADSQQPPDQLDLRI